MVSFFSEKELPGKSGVAGSALPRRRDCPDGKARKKAAQKGDDGKAPANAREMMKTKREKGKRRRAREGAFACANQLSCA